MAVIDLHSFEADLFLLGQAMLDAPCCLCFQWLLTEFCYQLASYSIIQLASIELLNSEFPAQLAAAACGS